MKHIVMFLASVSLVFTTTAQTPVDRLVRHLDSLSLHSFDNWKVSPDLRSTKSFRGDPTKPGFDDSSWETLNLDQSIYHDSCWIRKEIILPEKILGRPFQGTIKLFVSVDDYGYLWINGQSKGHFPWEGEFELTKEARRGERFVIAIKAINTGGPLRLIRASLESELARPAYELIKELSLGLRTAQKLLSFDTYQTNARRKVDPKIDKSGMDRTEKIQLTELLQNSASRFDLQSLSDGNLETFKASIDRLNQTLEPVARYCKRFTLHLVSNAHIDAAWLWRQKETVEVCKNTFTSVLDMMDTRPDFSYVQSSAVYYEWMEKLYPDIFKRIRGRVKDGRWEVVGGMWVEPDCNLPGGESWARHLLYSKRYFKHKLGVDVKIGWNPDSFGYNWNMPQIYGDAGIDAFITQKIGWNEHTVFPHRVFWWEAPDRSRILTYFPFDYVNELTNPNQLIDWARQFEANTGFTRMMVLFGVGDHGGGPSREMLDRVNRLKEMDFYPQVEYGTAAQYLEWLKHQNLDGIPVWNDELYLEYHQGTFTTQAAMKQFNRRSEALLTNAEKFSTIATLFKETYDSKALEDAWRLVLFNQFHDILPGSSIREVYIDATASHLEAESIARKTLQRVLQVIAEKVNTAAIGPGLPIVVFNPLSWDRSDIVRVVSPRNPDETDAIYDSDGKQVPMQIARVDRYNVELVFRAENVPPMGYKAFTLGKRKAARVSGPFLPVDSTSIENEHLRVSIDQSSGWVNSIYDKRNKRELCQGEGNKLQFLEDQPSAWDAWNIGLTGVEFPSQFRKIEIVEDGPVRATLRLHRDYRKPGTSAGFPTEDFPTTFVTQDITLYSGSDQVFFTTQVDWWEDKTMLKVAFPVDVRNDIATYEIPFGFIERSTGARDSARIEVPAHRWADLSAETHGVSILNRAKYGHDIRGNVIRLSLLRSPKWPDPTADRGIHTIEYALYPHNSRWQEAGTVQRGYEYNNPLIAVATDIQKGRLPPVHSFLNLSPSNLVLATVKKAEDSDAWIIQFYDSRNESCTGKLELPMAPERALLSNIMEEDGASLTIQGNTVIVPTAARSMVTVKVYY